jgi:diacylglycerol kinase family enzyme
MIRILINSGGGTLKRGVAKKEDIVAALQAAGIDAEPEWIEGKDLATRAEAAVADGAEIVVAGGGDGTISAVASIVAGSSSALGVLPLGTLNHFAKDLGVPADLEGAAKLIASGSRTQVDLAEVNGRNFINNSAIGLYPLMVLDREAQQEELGRSKRWAMLVAAARTVANFSSERLKLTVNGREAVVDTPLLFVGNNAYTTELPSAGTRDRVDRGELFVLVLRRKSRFGFCLAALRSLLGRARRDDVVRLEHVDELTVDSRSRSLHLSLDGETVKMKPPLRYRIKPGVLTVISTGASPRE